MARKDGSFVVIFKDQQRREVFLVYRSDWPIWNLTGGGVDPGETPEKAAVREAFEETGFKIKIDRKLGEYLNYNPGTGDLVNKVFLYSGHYLSGSFIPEFPGCKGNWFSVKHLPLSITNRTSERIRDAVNFNGREFSKPSARSQLQNNLHLMLLHPIAAFKYFNRK